MGEDPLQTDAEPSAVRKAFEDLGTGHRRYLHDQNRVGGGCDFTLYLPGRAFSCVPLRLTVVSRRFKAVGAEVGPENRLADYQ